MFHPYVSSLKDCASHGGGGGGWGRELDIERCTLFFKRKNTHFFLLQRDYFFFFKQKYLEKREKLPIKKWTRGLIKALEHSYLGYKYMMNERKYWEVLLELETLSHAV